MDDPEVIVIEDSPPGSPSVCTNIRSTKNVVTSKHCHPNVNFLQRPPIMSHRFANLSPQQRARFLTPRNNIQSRSNLMIPAKHPYCSQVKSQPKRQLDSYGYSLNRQNYFHKSIPLEFVKRDNFWMTFNLPNTKTLSKYYYDEESESPIQITNIHSYNPIVETSENSMPEFIDVNTFADKYFPKRENTDNVTETQTTANTFETTSQSEEVAISNGSNDPLIELDNDSNDLIIVEEIASESMSPKLTQNNKETSTPRPRGRPKNSTVKEEKEKVEKYDKKRKRLLDGCELRRNPKRKVQVEREVINMITQVITKTDKEKKIKTKQKNKCVKTKPKRGPSSKTSLEPVGAIYSPPSPLTIKHIREWPSEGMHERPEYNPLTGTIHSFDYYIRNVADSFNINKTLKDNQNPSPIKQFTVNQEADKPLPEVCHEMMHHVLSFIATVKNFDKQNENGESQKDKSTLVESEKVPDSNSIDLTIKDSDLSDLLRNSAFMYCLTNNVTTQDVANYIKTLNPEEIIKLSNEQFNLDSSILDKSI